jgi:hypothetical protein
MWNVPLDQSVRDEVKRKLSVCPLKDSVNVAELVVDLIGYASYHKQFGNHNGNQRYMAIMDVIHNCLLADNEPLDPAQRELRYAMIRASVDDARELIEGATGWKNRN